MDFFGLLGFFGGKFIKLTIIGTKVTTKHQKWPKTCPNNTKILAQALEVGLRSGQSLLVAIKRKLSICLEKTSLYFFFFFDKGTNGILE